MSKIFSKILIVFTLTLILFGSGISFKKDSAQNINVRIGIKEVFSATEAEDLVCNDYASGSQSRYYCGVGFINGNCPPLTQAELATACNVGLEGRTGRPINDEGKAAWYVRAIEYAGSMITGVIGKTIMMIQGILLQLIAIPILSTFLRIVAAMLDISIKFTLNTEIFRKTGEGVIKVWTLIRDICNITFIFILLFTAIKTILGSAGADTKKMIANVITAAILINFSLFITRIIIDAGNMLAVSLYNLIMATPTIIMVNGEPVTAVGRDFSSILVDVLGLSGVFGMSKVAGSVYSIAFGIISWLQVITLLAAIVVFMYALLLMASRIVILIFLAAMSPIGFMGNVLPKFGEYSKMWRENLYGQVMIAPVFLLFIYLIVLIGGQFNTVPESRSITTSEVVGGEIAATTGGALNTPNEDHSNNYIAYFKYLMIIILLMAAVKVTKKMTGEMGKIAEKFGGMAVGAALGMATGGVALLGRQTIGRGAAALASNEGLANAATKGGLSGFGARMALKSANSTSKASFDARNTKSFKSATGFVGDKTGLKVDYDSGIKIKKDGYTGFIEGQQKKAEENMKRLGSNEAEKEAEKKSKIIGERDKIVAEKAEKEKAILDSMAEVRSLQAKERATGQDTSAAVALVQQKIDKAKERSQEIDKRVLEINGDPSKGTKGEYQDNFGEDISTANKIEIDRMAKAGVERQKTYLKNYQKTISGRFEGLSMNLNEKKKIAQKLRSDILKKETDIDKIIKGVTSKSPSDKSATPPPAKP